MTTRRGFLLGAGETIAGGVIPTSRRMPAQTTGPAPPSKPRLILLGTGGGPRPRKSAMSTAQVILANDVPYVVDCANGVARQLVRAGVTLARDRHPFITHHHSDHKADYSKPLLPAGGSGIRTPGDTWRAPPLAKTTQLLFAI